MNATLGKTSFGMQVPVLPAATRSKELDGLSENPAGARDGAGALVLQPAPQISYLRDLEVTRLKVKHPHKLIKCSRKKAINLKDPTP